MAYHYFQKWTYSKMPFGTAGPLNVNYSGCILKLFNLSNHLNTLEFHPKTLKFAYDLHQKDNVVLHLLHFMLCVLQPLQGQETAGAVNIQNFHSTPPNLCHSLCCLTDRA